MPLHQIERGDGGLAFLQISWGIPHSVLKLTQTDKNSMKVPKPKMLMSKDVVTPFGVRQIKLLWGNVIGADEHGDEVIDQDSTVFLSSVLFNEKNQQPTGEILNCLRERFDIEPEFREVLVASESSAVWRDSSAHGFRPHISYYERPIEIISGPAHIFCLSHFPFKKQLEKYDSIEQCLEEGFRKSLAACFVAYKAQEARRMVDEVKGVPIRQLVFSGLLGSTSSGKPELLFREILSQATTWFNQSPELMSMKICLYDELIERELDDRLGAERGDEPAELESDDIELVRLRLFNLLGFSDKDLVNFSGSNLRAEILKEFKSMVLSSLNPERVEKGLSAPLQEMLWVLDRKSPQIFELGASMGKVIEALVANMCHHFYGEAQKDFFSGIEKLSTDRPKSEDLRGLKLSPWYKSYLHGLRVLRNQCAHAAGQDEGQFPQSLEEDDIWVMVFQSNRVLSLHFQLLDKLKSK